MGTKSYEILDNNNVESAPKRPKFNDLYVENSVKVRNKFDESDLLSKKSWRSHKRSHTHKNRNKQNKSEMKNGVFSFTHCTLVHILIVMSYPHSVLMYPIGCVRYKSNDTVNTVRWNDVQSCDGLLSNTGPSPSPSAAASSSSSFKCC